MFLVSKLFFYSKVSKLLHFSYSLYFNIFLKFDIVFHVFLKFTQNIFSVLLSYKTGFKLKKLR